MSRKKMYVVTLTAEERSCLQGLLAKGKAAAHRQLHARILLKADVSGGGEELTDEQVAEAVETSRPTVERVRQRFVEEGLEAALNRKKRPAPPPRVMDGLAEAHRITRKRPSTKPLLPTKPNESPTNWKSITRPSTAVG
jgi:hypothetical protein